MQGFATYSVSWNWYSGYGWQLGRDFDRNVQATIICVAAKDEVEKVTKKINNIREDEPNKQ